MTTRPAAPPPPDLSERLAVTRFVAEHWRDSYMEAFEAGDSKWSIGLHPLALVLAALDGERDPRELGLPESVDEAFRSLLSDTEASRDGAALPAEGTE